MIDPSKRGPAALCASVLLLIVVLLWVQRGAATPAERLAVLLGGNAVAGAGLLVPRLTERPIIPSDWRSRAGLVLWSTAYVAIYPRFVAIGTRGLPLPVLLIIQALAPLLAVFLSGDWRRASGRRGDIVLRAAPVASLVALGYLQLRSVHVLLSGHLALALLGLFLAFVSSRTMARIIARGHAPTWSPPRLGAANTMLMLVVLCVCYGGHWGKPFGSGIDLQQLPHAREVIRLVLMSTVTGGAILLLQSLGQFGLRHTEPVASAVLLSTNVPLSLVLSDVVASKRLPVLDTLLSLTYCALVGFLTMCSRQRDDAAARADVESMCEIAPSAPAAAVEIGS